MGDYTRYTVVSLTTGALALCWGGRWGSSSPDSWANESSEKSAVQTKQTHAEFKTQGGGKIPHLGFGTATLFGERCTTAVAEAIKLGYRHVDTALLYANHEAVGAGIRKSGVSREEIWVTSKIAFFPPESAGVWMYGGIGEEGNATSPGSVGENNEMGKEEASIDLALQQLQLEYVDLLLIHNPCSSVPEYNAACMPHFFELIGKFSPVLRPLISGYWCVNLRCCKRTPACAACSFVAVYTGIFSISGSALVAKVIPHVKFVLNLGRHWKIFKSQAKLNISGYRITQHLCLKK